MFTTLYKCPHVHVRICPQNSTAADLLRGDVHSSHHGLQHRQFGFQLGGAGVEGRQGQTPLRHLPLHAPLLRLQQAQVRLHVQNQSAHSQRKQDQVC